MTWLVPMDSLGFLVSCDTSIFTLALKLSCYNLRKIDCVKEISGVVGVVQLVCCYSNQCFSLIDCIFHYFELRSFTLRWYSSYLRGSITQKLGAFPESDSYEPTVRRKVRESLDKNTKMFLHEALCFFSLVNLEILGNFASITRFLSD